MPQHRLSQSIGRRRLPSREVAVTVVLAMLLATLAAAAPGFFNPGNLRDIALTNLPVLITSIGLTLIILARQIDVAIGSQFAICTVVTGLLAQAGLPLLLVAGGVILVGMILGTINGGLIAYGRIPAIVVTLAMMIILRDGLKWFTDGAWIQGLPTNFQWFGLGQPRGQLVILLLSAAIWLSLRWMLDNLAVGRAVYAIGNDAEAARLAGISPQRLTLLVFGVAGGLTGLASLLNSIRCAELQSTAGLGLELKTIAAVVVGGTSISGGRGTLTGSLLGVALLGTIGTALTFLGVSPSWEKAIQGIIILGAVSSDLFIERMNAHARAKDSRH